MQGTDTTNAPARAAAERSPSSYELAVLRGLQGKPVYQGTTPDGVKTQRRSKNRAARKSRRINRKGR